EALETEYPLVVERYALVDGSGGVGRWRGGRGLLRRIRVDDHRWHAFVHGSRRLSAPWGLFGGGEGGRGRLGFSPGVDHAGRAQAFLEPGQSVTIITPGAGGYGEPSDRDPALVRRDVEEGSSPPSLPASSNGLAGARLPPPCDNEQEEDTVS